MVDRDTRIQYLKGVGEKRSGQFAKLGVYSVGALLRYYPLRYEDWSALTPIAAAMPDEVCSVKAVVLAAPVALTTKSGTKLYKTDITDGTDVLTVTFFNNKYVTQQLEKGSEYIFYGKLTRNRFGCVEMLSPDFCLAQKGEYIRPVYRQSGTLTSKTIERCVAAALKELSGSQEETLPEDIIKRYRLPSLWQALNAIHFPQSADELAGAKRRLIFEELLVLQLGLLKRKSATGLANSPVLGRDYTAEFLASLPFEPTGAQLRSVNELAADMAKPHPMSRLLAGDVGSGKTAVAAAAIYSAVKNGLQCVLMAPTEVLATQHYNTLRAFFKDDINVELLTGSVSAKEKKRIKADVLSGQCQVLTGTHAVIQKDVQFARLGLTVTDEQHRFGVAQRSALGAKGENPHMLVMSATPIPRTLAMMIYGDLDVSLLDESPKGRIPVRTYAVTSSFHSRVYEYVKKHLNSGRQGFVICPLVEEGDSSLTPAVQYYEYLKNTVFRGFNVGLLHGQMKPKEKDAVMSEFVNGSIKLLVSTVVIEVGIDVPNATVMVIENAERFGLSQLHQLRGRIGRSSFVSDCILISDAQNTDATERFDILCKNSDGFKIADKDLEMRGPGDFFGSRQHGLPQLQIANLMTDTRALAEAGRVAKSIIARDPELKSPVNAGLAGEIERLFELAQGV